MSFNKYIFIIIGLLTVSSSWGQDCSLTLQGYVKDADTGIALEYVNIYMEENGKGAVSDSMGYFTLTDICKGEYHLVSSHVGCQSNKTFFTLLADSTIQIAMEHFATHLHGVVITDKSSQISTENTAVIGEQEILDNSNDNIATLLENTVGVRSLKNGNNIGKPIVHGLFGNRISLLNNGVAQSGQQWGNDHSPEIDPLVANRISVVKGTSALAYMSSSLGSVILIEPKKIGKEPHLHGRFQYRFATNGLGQGVHIKLNKYSPTLAWKISGTLKANGDQRSPDYFLKNTGQREANLALQLEKSFKNNWTADLYLSTFNTALGILRGSSIGNLTDLEAAFVRDQPFFTESQFNFNIAEPRQDVNHHFLKLHTQHFFDDNQWIDLVASTQVNDRKEFDIRRGNRSDIPALSLRQISIFAEAKYQREWSSGWTLKTGIQHNFTDNTNDPDTGILPLIPDYFSYKTGVYNILSKTKQKSTFNFGLRYDNILQKVVTISATTPRIIERFDNNYSIIKTSAGYAYSLNEDQTLKFNIGYAGRNPGINELYSAGLHQGVSGIEEGDRSLEVEHAVKATANYTFAEHDHFMFEALVYFQRIDNYIFLQAQDELRLTIRGAFPLFTYEQTNADLFGFDLSSNFMLQKNFKAEVKYSFLIGEDRQNNEPLVFLPANNLMANLKFIPEKPLLVFKKQIENFEATLTNSYVFEQTRLLPSQDFLPAPPAYYLLGLKIAGDFQHNKFRLRGTLKVDNLLNARYRDYLNRQRYFADELGTNITFIIGVQF